MPRRMPPNPFVLSLSKHCFSYGQQIQKEGQPFDRLRANGILR